MGRCGSGGFSAAPCASAGPSAGLSSTRVAISSGTPSVSEGCAYSSVSGSDFELFTSLCPLDGFPGRLEPGRLDPGPSDPGRLSAFPAGPSSPSSSASFVRFDMAASGGVSRRPSAPAAASSRPCQPIPPAPERGRAGDLSSAADSRASRLDRIDRFDRTRQRISNLERFPLPPKQQIPQVGRSVSLVILYLTGSPSGAPHAIPQGRLTQR